MSCGSPGTASSLTIPWIVPEDLVTVRPFSLSFFNTAHAHETEIDHPHPLQLSIHQVHHDDGNAATTTGDGARQTRRRGPRASDLRGWSAGVGAAHYFPRGLIENLYGAERQSLLRHRYTPAGEPGGGAGVLLLVPLLLPLMLPCWWWWWWSRERDGRQAWVGGRAGGGRRAGRPGAEQRRKTKVAEGATRSDRDGASWSSSFECACAVIRVDDRCKILRLPLTLRELDCSRPPRCVCAGANEIGGKYATLRATRSRRLFRQELCGFLLPVDCFPSLLFSSLSLSPRFVVRSVHIVDWCTKRMEIDREGWLKKVGPI